MYRFGGSDRYSSTTQDMLSATGCPNPCRTRLPVATVRKSNDQQSLLSLDHAGRCHCDPMKEKWHCGKHQANLNELDRAPWLGELAQLASSICQCFSRGDTKGCMPSRALRCLSLCTTHWQFPRRTYMCNTALQFDDRALQPSE